MVEVVFILLFCYLGYLVTVGIFHVTVHFLRKFSQALWEFRGLLLLLAALLVLLQLGVF